MQKNAIQTVFNSELREFAYQILNQVTAKDYVVPCVHRFKIQTIPQDNQFHYISYVKTSEIFKNRETHWVRYLNENSTKSFWKSTPPLAQTILVNNHKYEIKLEIEQELKNDESMSNFIVKLMIMAQMINGCTDFMQHSSLYISLVTILNWYLFAYNQKVGKLHFHLLAKKVESPKPE